MDKQSKVLKQFMRFYCNLLMDNLRNPYKWDEVYEPAQPDGYLGGHISDYEKQPWYHKLDFVFFNAEGRTVQTVAGEMLIPSLKFRLLIGGWLYTLAPYVHDLQTICPSHTKPFEPPPRFGPPKNCQHECILGWMLKDTHSPFVSTPVGYRLNSGEGYKHEHGQLIMQLLEACTLRTMDDTPITFSDILT